MAGSELAHLEVLAEVDALVDRLNRWSEDAPTWQPAEKCRALVRRLADRADSLRVRLEAPLVVATLGGTGTGKSALVNALLGAEVVQTGRSRPTTTRPTLICRPGLTPELLGIERSTVEWIERDLPALRDLVFVDCPDPDTTEEGREEREEGRGKRGEGRGERGEGREEKASGGASLVPSPLSPLLSPLAERQPRTPASDPAEVRRAAGYCHTAEISQRPRGRRACRRGARSASGFRADTCRHRCRHSRRLAANAGGRKGRKRMRQRGQSHFRDHGFAAVPAKIGTVPHVFRIDSLRALADAQANLQPRGEFAELVDLLTRQMASAAGNRIRRANFLDLVGDTLDACGTRIDEGLPSVREAGNAVEEQRALLATQLAGRMQAELLANRRQWENRLLGQAASRWGFSPFALVLRAYQGIGSLFAGALLYRSRTPAQMALWGAFEGVRTWRRHQQNRRAERSVGHAAGWEPAELRKATLIVEGYVVEAGLGSDIRRPRQTGMSAPPSPRRRWPPPVSSPGRRPTSSRSSPGWPSGIPAGLRAGVTKSSCCWYSAYCCTAAARTSSTIPGWRPIRRPCYGLEFYASAGLWLLLWCLVLLWAFCSRLRGGLRSEIAKLAAGWNDTAAARPLFASVESDCHRVERFHQDLGTIRQEVDRLRRQVATG